MIPLQGIASDDQQVTSVCIGLYIKGDYICFCGPYYSGAGKEKTDMSPRKLHLDLPTQIHGSNLAEPEPLTAIATRITLRHPFSVSETEKIRNSNEAFS